MKVLITGASGFLGGHLVARLMREGYSIRVLARKTSDTSHLPQQNVQVFYGDLKDRDSLIGAVHGIDIVFHAGAAISGPWPALEQATVNGTRQLLEASMAAGVQRFVHISSVVVYQVGHLKNNALIDESCPIEPRPEAVGPYARSKVEAEKLVFKYYQKGLPAVVVRPGLIYGPRGKLFWPNIGFIKGKLCLVLGSGDDLLPLTYVDSVTDALALAATRREAVGRAYHIVDGQGMAKRDYLRLYMEATGSRLMTVALPVPLLAAPVALASALSRLGVLQGIRVPSGYGIRSKYRGLRFDCSRAIRELGWNSATTLDEGLKRTFEWHRGR